MPSTGETLFGTRRCSVLAAGHSKPPGGRHPLGRGVLVSPGHIPTRTRWAGARPRTGNQNHRAARGPTSRPDCGRGFSDSGVSLMCAVYL